MPRVLFACLGFILAGTVALEAQTPREHRGFWIGFGLGGGVNVTESLDDATLAGGAAYLRLGWTLSQRLLLGAEGIGWNRERDDENLSRGNGTATLLFYPSRSGGLFLKGGIGGASVSVSVEENGATTTTSKGGFGATAGLGYEIRLASNFYLTPAFDWLFQAFDADSDTSLGDIPGTNSILLLTVGVLWH